MEPDQLYAESARDWAEAAQYHATQAKRTARQFDPTGQTILVVGLNFIVSLLLITLLR